MAYQELWMPIQNAIQNVNQTINTISDRADRRQAQGLQSLLTADSLVGRQINRDLAQKQDRRADQQMNLSKAANARAERQAQLNEQNLTHQQQMDRKRLALRQAEFKATEPQRRLQAAVAEEALIPRSVSLDTFFPGAADEAISTGTAHEMASILGGTGSTFDPQSRTFIDPQGKPMQMTKIQLKSVYPIAAGLAIASGDPRRIETQRAAALEEEISRMSDNLKKIKSNSRVPNRAAAELEYALKKKKENLESLSQKKDWEYIDVYEKRQQMLDQSAMYAESLGIPVTSLINASKQNSDILDTLYEAKEDHLTGGKGGTGITQRWAMQVDDDGNPIPGTTVLVNTPKNMLRSMYPEEVDPGLTGYVWKEGVETDLKLKESGQLDTQWMNGYRVLRGDYTSENAKGQFVITKGLEDEYRIAKQLYSEFYDAMNGDFGRAAAQARNTAQDALTQYHNLMDEWEYQVDTGETKTGEPVNVKGVIKDMKEFEKKFKETFGFLPTL